MNRSDFIKKMVASPLLFSVMNLKSFGQLAFNAAVDEEQLPALFLGHGSPMNAIEENEFVSGFRLCANKIAKPRAILVISAHWETRGTFVTAMENPKTIHDFGGFPEKLFQVQYPAPGSPALAEQTKAMVKKTAVGLDHSWGLDHGSWSVIKHLYPKADIPVVQMSIDYTKDALYHYELAAELKMLRNKGVLIVGSGNMVHNLGMVAWDKLNMQYGYDWALEASEQMKKYINEGNHDSLIRFKSQGKAWNLAIPTPEHFLPLLYILALKGEKESVSLFNDKPLAGSLTMTSLKIG
jgi:4,5-DOPA dioxygenase extradiol